MTLILFSNCSCAVSDYIEEAKELACKILELVAEGLWVPDKFSLSKFIKDVDCDSVLRINHYPPVNKNQDQYEQLDQARVGFGEHSDPQILTIMRSNNVGGLQIETPDGLWLPVSPDPNEFFVMVGDALQVSCFLTNLVTDPETLYREGNIFIYLFYFCRC